MLSEDIDELWTFNDPSTSESRFKELLDKTEAGPLHAEILTQLARSLGLQRKFEEAKELLEKSKSEIMRLEDADPTESVLIDLRVSRTRHLLELGRVINSSGDASGSIRYFRMAIQISRLGPSERLQYYEIDGLHMLAIVESEVEVKVQRTQEALEICEKSTYQRTQGWILSLLNNLGWTFHDNGRYEEALDAFQKAEQYGRKRLAAGDSKFDERVRIARWTVARTLRSLERFDEALEIQRVGELEKKDGYVYEELALLKARGYARLCLDEKLDLDEDRVAKSSATSE
ncbi:hypothetical protein BC829DRAFT_387671 [Chytridium lagenaria]|nr:hypothetical protein BC829DRAFT_387671 [Chytridium lagenaria]